MRRLGKYHTRCGVKLIIGFKWEHDVSAAASGEFLLFFFVVETNNAYEWNAPTHCRPLRPATVAVIGEGWAEETGTNGTLVRSVGRREIHCIQPGRLKFRVYGRVSRCIGGNLGTRARAFTSLRRGDPSACRSPSPRSHPFA